MPGFDESHKIAKREIFGDSVRRISSRLALSSGAISETPVTLPPGLARLATRPTPTGSLLAPSTIGIVPVDCLAAKPAGVPIVTMTSTCCATRSAAKAFRRSMSPSADLARDDDVLALRIAELAELAHKRQP